MRAARKECSGGEYDPYLSAITFGLLQSWVLPLAKRRIESRFRVVEIFSRPAQIFRGRAILRLSQRLIGLKERYQFRS